MPSENGTTGARRGRLPQASDIEGLSQIAD
jgi:hypothetical protein